MANTIIVKKITVCSLVFIIMVFIVFTSSCASENRKDEIIPAAETATNSETNTNETNLETAIESVRPEETEPVSDDIDKEIGDFAIKTGSKYISLRNWDSDIDIYEMFGQSLSETTEVLGEGSDTFAGSFLKTIKFDGLELKLFSPSDNGKTFWIMDMKITGKEHETSKGVSVGDPLDVLKDKYPSISRVEDGRTDPNNCAYLFAEMENYNYLLFEVTQGIISQIHIYHEIP